MGGEGTRQFLNMLLLVKEQPWSLVSQAIERCALRRAFNEEAVRLELLRLVNGPSVQMKQSMLDLSQHPQLQNVNQGTRSLKVYDALLEEHIVESHMPSLQDGPIIEDVFQTASLTDHVGPTQKSDSFIPARKAHEYQEEPDGKNEPNIAGHDSIGDSTSHASTSNDAFGVLQGSQTVFAR